jgi:AbiV family abortive infection protein
MKKHDIFLSKEQAAQCARACIDNAYRLLEASKLLHKKDFIELAIFSVCTAIEEGGKAIFLLEYRDDMIEGKDVSLHKLKKVFYDHKIKLEYAITASKIDNQTFGAIKNRAYKSGKCDDVTQRIFKIIKDIRDLDVSREAEITFNSRNKGIYTEVKDGRIFAPRDSIDKSQFGSLLDIAEKILARAELNVVISDICFNRGMSTRQFGEFIMAELPKIVEMMKKRLEEKKYIGPAR